METLYLLEFLQINAIVLVFICLLYCSPDYGV